LIIPAFRCSWTKKSLASAHTGFWQRIAFNTPSLPATFPAKETPEGKEIREKWNSTALDSWFAFSPHLAQLYTDGGVQNQSSFDCRAAGAGQLWLPTALHTAAAHRSLLETTPDAEFTTPCSPLSCSYSAEMCALHASVTAPEFLHALTECATRLRSASPPRRPFLLIVSDSLSLIEAIQKGPLLCTETYILEVILVLRTLVVESNYDVAFQFVFSHVGTSGNESVDQLVDRTITNLPTAAFLTAPVWLVDEVRAVCNFLTRQWHLSDDVRTSYRARFHGLGAPPLRQLQAWQLPRSLQIEFSRARTGTTILFGQYRITLGITSSTKCRWCFAAENPDRPAQCSSLALAEAPPVLRDSLHCCTHCYFTFETSASLRRHCDLMHNGDHGLFQPAVFICDCHRVFDTRASLRVHRQTCRLWLSSNPSRAPAMGATSVSPSDDAVDGIDDVTNSLSAMRISAEPADGSIDGDLAPALSLLSVSASSPSHSPANPRLHSPSATDPVVVSEETMLHFLTSCKGTRDLRKNVFKDLMVIDERAEFRGKFFPVLLNHPSLAFFLARLAQLPHWDPPLPAGSAPPASL
jgi:hypothetical protein